MGVSNQTEIRKDNIERLIHVGIIGSVLYVCQGCYMIHLKKGAEYLPTVDLQSIQQIQEKW